MAVFPFISLLVLFAKSTLAMEEPEPLPCTDINYLPWFLFATGLGICAGVGIAVCFIRNTARNYFEDDDADDYGSDDE
jgi:hypothetical protein